MKKPYRVFCCYAHKDQDFLRDLKTHLKSLEREGLITVKADIDISPGIEWEPTISHGLEIADIILLLISPDFLASHYCFDIEMQHAIARHEQGTARIVPVIIRPASWQRMPFGKLQALPKDATPISTSQDRDTAFLSVINGLRIVVREFTTDVPGSLWEAREEKWQQQPEKVYPSPDSSQERNDMGSNNSGKYNFSGSVNAEHGHFGDNIYNGEHKDGIRSLEKGTQALRNGDYPSAKKELRVAVDEIDGEKQSREASKANYLFALALLDGQLPRLHGDAVMQALERSMNNAIRLSPYCASYYRMLAGIKRDFFEYNGLRFRLNEVQILQSKAASLPRSIDDEEIEYYCRYCQPRLPI